MKFATTMLTITDSARFSLEYVELYATAMGLGTLLGRLCNGGEFTK